MPLYDFQCTECQKVQEIFCCINELDSLKMKQRCECGAPMKQILSIAKAMDWFRPHVNYDFDGTPIEVTSKSHLKELCKRHGVYAKALL